MKTAVTLAAFVSIALVALLAGNPPIPASGVVPRCVPACDCGCNVTGICVCNSPPIGNRVVLNGDRAAGPCACRACAAAQENIGDCSATPDRKDPLPPPRKETPIPQSAGPSNWGDITQHLREVQIDGHPSWYAGKGEITKDGKLLLEWICRSDGKPAIGLYVLGADGSIIGHWGWVGEAFIDKGIMYGPQNSETLRGKANDDDD